MKKPKYFKGAKKKHTKKLKEPVVAKEASKKKTPEAVFPKNSRAIPESPKKIVIPKMGKLPRIRAISFLKNIHVWLQVWNVIAIIVLCALCVGVTKSVQLVQEKNREREVLLTQMKKWEDIAHTHPGYRDAYLQLAALAYELGNKNEAAAYVDKALAFDPNNEIGLKLEEEIAKGQ